MRTLTLLAAGIAASAGDKAVITVGMKTPFLPGRMVRAIFDPRGQTGSDPVYQIDGSMDNSTWTADVAESNVTKGEGLTSVMVEVYKYMRVTVTTAAGSSEGTLGVHLEAP